MNKPSYNNLLIQRGVKEFVETNNRSPSKLELDEKIRELEKRYPNLDEVGFVGHEITRPQYASISSAQDENANRTAFLDDLILASDRIGSLSSKLERQYRSAYATTRNINNSLMDIESRLDNLLLLTGSTDLFVYGVEENFVDHSLVDFNLSTASIENGFITIGRDGFGLIPSSDLQFKFNTVADKGYLTSQVSSSVNSLGTDDGNVWNYLVYTNYPTGRVNLILDTILDEPQFVSEIRFTTSSLSLNSNMRVTVLYSFDEITYKSVQPFEMTIEQEENVFSIGLDNVKSIRLLLSKDSYDDTTAIPNQYVYIFSLDSIKLYSQSYAVDAQSVFYAGPYSIYDESGDAVNFTKATCDVCVAQGDESGVSAYLSIDGESYSPAGDNSSSLNIVTFANGSSEGSELIIDENTDARKLITNTLVPFAIDEAILNTGVQESYSNKIIQKSIQIKRNLPVVDNGTRTQVYKIDSGWYYDESTNLYSTTIYTTNDTQISLGSTSAYLNGLQVSGDVFIPSGYHVFETSRTNWQAISPSLNRVSLLQKADSLYPYNHKYLIEGYPYIHSFKGERVYYGVQEYFGKLLTYVPLELFSLPENGNNFSIFTLEDIDGDVYFKVKINPADTDWNNEYCNVDWSIKNGQSNVIYLKLLLESINNKSSPVVNNVKIRVI